MRELDLQQDHSLFFSAAAEKNCLPARIAIENGAYAIRGSAALWRDPIMFEDVDHTVASTILLDDESILSRVATTLSNSVQFPRNTILAHSLGIVASAMSKAFKFEYYGSEKPVNLYVLTGQPPSSGKSGCHEALSNPVQFAFDAINKTATVERKKISMRIDSAKQQLKSAKHTAEKDGLMDELAKLYEKLDETIVYLYSVGDSTPEALTEVALGQNGGMFNVVSAEAEAISVLFGDVYGNDTGSRNFGIVLKGWDSERHTVARANKKIVDGVVTGCIVVMAQDASIDAAFEAGLSGRGVVERFLIVREANFLGQRNHKRRVPRDKELMAQYGNLIFNIVREKNIVLKFDDESLDLLDDVRQRLEPELGDNGIYSNDMMRGFVGKMDKQIMKIASILHTANNWQDGGSKSVHVELNTFKTAIDIFMSIIDSYQTAADQLGFTGLDSEVRKIQEKLMSYAEKGKNSIPFETLRSSIKNTKPFKGTPNIPHKLRQYILPMLEKSNICILNKGTIYLNPSLKG